MSNFAALAAIGVTANADAMHRHLMRTGRKLYGPLLRQLTGAASGWRVMRCAVAELSPAARAIMDAYIDEDRAGRIAVAAALRAAADQVAIKLAGLGQESAWYLEEIATELEAQ